MVDTHAHARYIVSPQSVAAEQKVAGRTQFDHRDLVAFAVEVGKRAPIDTGVLPGTGLISYRQAGTHSQIVVQCAPGLNQIVWGYSERDRNAKQLQVAQPWRIYIGEFINGNFLGARVFYSPVPIHDGTQALYHQNTPNINCKGYGQTSVGWVCLYHTKDTTSMSINERAQYIGVRCSGNEAYNDANMSGTDGARFYKAKNKPDYTYDGLTWEKKSLTEGWEWVQDPKLWIPIKVKGENEQACHDDHGVPLTLHMAMYGAHYNYYKGRHPLDKDADKFMNKLERGAPGLAPVVIEQIFQPAFAAAKRTKVMGDVDGIDDDELSEGLGVRERIVYVDSTPLAPMIDTGGEDGTIDMPSSAPLLPALSTTPGNVLPELSGNGAANPEIALGEIPGPVNLDDLDNGFDDDDDDYGDFETDDDSIDAA